MNLRTRYDRLLFAVCVTLVHMALTVMTFFWSFSVVMSHADDGLPLPFGGRMILWVSQAFQAPLISGIAHADYLQKVLPSYFAVIILFLNSLLWGLVALGVVTLATRNRQRDAGTATDG